jgi:hypothetical protein
MLVTTELFTAPSLAPASPDSIQRRSRGETAMAPVVCPTTSAQRRLRHATLLAENGSPDAARTTLECLIGGNDLVGINFLELGMPCACSHSDRGLR